MRLRKSKKRELDLITELQLMYGYVFGAMPRSERASVIGIQQQTKGGKVHMKLRSAVDVRVAVPTGSAMGRKIAAAYRADDKKIARAKAAKEAKRTERAKATRAQLHKAWTGAAKRLAKKPAKRIECKFCGTSLKGISPIKPFSPIYNRMCPERDGDPCERYTKRVS